MDSLKPTTYSTQPAAQKAQTGHTSPAVGRRAALLAVGATGVAGVTALAIPQIRTTLEQDAAALGRQALAHELSSLEGITLDEAIKVAEITNSAVHLLVVPLAQLVATIGGDGLAVLLAGLTTATNVLSSVHVTVAGLTGLRDTVASWHRNIASLPIALASYTTANSTNAEAYLKALKQKTQT